MDLEALLDLSRQASVESGSGCLECTAFTLRIRNDLLDL